MRQLTPRDRSGRPRSDVRDALLEAAQVLALAHGGATWPEIVAQSGLQLGREAGRVHVQNMLRAGDLERCGDRAVEGSRRPMGLYAPRQAQPAAALIDVIRWWAL